MDLSYNEENRIIFRKDNNKIPTRHLFCLGIPTTGLVRFEWHAAMQNVMLPINVSVSGISQPMPFLSPLGYAVAEARNIIVQRFLKETEIDWLLFIDHDVLLHPNTYGFLFEHVKSHKYPIVGGLYYSKSLPSLPLVFRDYGNGPFMDFSIGDFVRVNGVHMGCTIIHRSILEYMYLNSPDVLTSDDQKVKEVFRSPKDFVLDPTQLTMGSLQGTEDLWFCGRIINENVLEKTGWSDLKDEQYPFLIDTRIFCGHITNDGDIFPPSNLLYHRLV